MGILSLATALAVATTLGGAPCPPAAVPRLHHHVLLAAGVDAFGGEARGRASGEADRGTAIGFQGSGMPGAESGRVPGLESTRAATPPAQPQAEVVIPGRQATEAAKSLVERNGNQNSVSVGIEDGKTFRYDLQGRSHFDKSQNKSFATPHMVTETAKPNPLPDGSVRYGINEGPLKPMAMSDVRTVRRVLINREKTGNVNNTDLTRNATNTASITPVTPAASSVTTAAIVPNATTKGVK